MNYVETNYAETFMPEVSVVLPVFNAATTVERAARSVLDQTLADIELVVIDDGSTDESAAIVKNLKDARLKIISQSHAGVVAAANNGTAHASATLIARMDADDVAHPTKLEKQLSWLREHELDAVGCQVRIVTSTGDAAKKMARYQRWINDDTLSSEEINALRFVEFPLVNPTILACREYFELGFRENDLPEDYDLMLRAAAHGMRFGKTPEVLFNWTDHDKRLTRSSKRYSFAAFTRCRQQHLIAGPLKGITEVDLWGVGRTGKPWLRWLQDQGITVRRAYDINERKVGEQIHGVEIVHPNQMTSADSTPLIIAVGASGARQLILPHIQKRGYLPGSNAWFVA